MLLCGVMLAGGVTGCGKKEAGLSEEKIINYDMPAEGEKIVELNIKDYGTVKIRLFAEECPKAVENFLGLVEQKYYDELIFHRVVKDFVIQGGDPKGNGTGGESMWGTGFKQEISSKLCHFEGALAYAVASDKLNNSQFYIVTGTTVTEHRGTGYLQEDQRCGGGFQEQAQGAGNHREHEGNGIPRPVTG